MGISPPLPAFQTVTLCSALFMQASGIRLLYSSRISFTFHCKCILKGGGKGKGVEGKGRGQRQPLSFPRAAA